MDNCIFCKIASGEIPANIIWENETHMAILDTSPKVKGMTVVIPKAHKPSYLFNNDDKDICELILATKQAAKFLEKGLGVEWVFMQAEGLEVSHLHTKLYPVYENYKEQLKEKPSAEELLDLAEEIRSKN